MNFFSLNKIDRSPCGCSAALAIMVAVIVGTGCASLSSGDGSKLKRDEAVYELRQGDTALHLWKFHEAEAHYAAARDLLRDLKFDERKAVRDANSIDPNFNPHLLEDTAQFYQSAARELYQTEDAVESDRNRILAEGAEAIALLDNHNDFLGARERLGRLALQSRGAPSLYEIYYWNAQALLASYDVDKAYASSVISANGVQRLASVGLPVRTPLLDVLGLQARILMRKEDWNGADAIYDRKPIGDKYRDSEWRWLPDSERSIGRAEVALAHAKAVKDNARPLLLAAAAHLDDAVEFEPRKAKAWGLRAQVGFLLDDLPKACRAADQACTLGLCAPKENNKDKCANEKSAK